MVLVAVLLNTAHTHAHGAVWDEHMVGRIACDKLPTNWVTIEETEICQRSDRGYYFGPRAHLAHVHMYTQP